MSFPSLAQAESLISEAQSLNPGPWVAHSRYVGLAAQAIAEHHSQLDPEAAFILGYLHDLGRRAGVTDMRHTLDGYLYLKELGFETAARICLTHVFPLKDLQAVAGKWDCTAQELDLIHQTISTLEFDEYDRLIQLCDALALPSGFSLIEKRLLDVTLRHGTNAYTVPRWKAYLGLQAHFDQALGQSIYRVLPGVVENTFGFVPA